MATAFKNVEDYITTTLASAIVAADLSMDVAAGYGASLPTAPFWATLGAGSNRESVEVTNVATDTCTITRAQLGTAALDWSANTIIRVNIVAQTIKDIHTAVNTVENAYVTGPAASTDNMIARHSGAAGKTLQDYTSNPPTISDTGDVTIDGDITVDNLITAGNVDGIDVSAHDTATTGVHGAGANTIATTNDITTDIATHAALTATHGAADIADVSDIAATKIDDLTAGDDNTDLDTSTTRHGLVPKAVAPAANILNVMGIANGETALTNKAIHDATNPAALAAAAAPGTSLICSHRDHVHLDPVVALKAILTTAGDIIYATAASTWARLAKGTAGKPLVMNSGATAPQWGLINRIAGITPTQADWDTAPTNLTNATDGNDATVTGTAQDAITAWWDSGYIQFDMGATYNVMCRAKLLVGTTYAGCNVLPMPRWSTDGTNWYKIPYYVYVNLNNTTTDIQMSFLVKCRYIRFYVTQDQNGTVQLAVYEMEGWQIA